MLRAPILHVCVGIDICAYACLSNFYQLPQTLSIDPDKKIPSIYFNPFDNLFYQRDFFWSKYTLLKLVGILIGHRHFKNTYNMKAFKINSYLQIALGSIFLTFGYSLFIIPHNIVPGGILGLSLVINKLTTLPIGTIALLINIPLLLLGTKLLGKQTGIKTAFSMVIVSTTLDLFTMLLPKQAIVNDILVSSIFGGIIIGLAVVIVMKAGATTGGNDILVRMIAKKTKRPINELMLSVDGIIVSIGIVVFSDFTLSAYCIIAIIAISKTIDYLLQKEHNSKTLVVFSEDNRQIQNTLNQNYFNRNSQVLKHMHLDDSNKLILITKSNKEVIEIKETISRTDPKARVIQINSNGI